MPHKTLKLICRSCFWAEKLYALESPHTCRGCDRKTETKPALLTDPPKICPVCGLAYFYIERDFSKPLGFFILLACVNLFLILNALSPSGWNTLVIAAGFALDAIIYKLAGIRTVCYNCLTEFRGFAANPDHKEYDLVIAARFTNKVGN